MLGEAAHRRHVRMSVSSPLWLVTRDWILLTLRAHVRSLAPELSCLSCRKRMIAKIDYNMMNDTETTSSAQHRRAHFNSFESFERSNFSHQKNTLIARCSFFSFSLRSSDNLHFSSPWSTNITFYKGGRRHSNRKEFARKEIYLSCQRSFM